MKSQAPAGSARCYRIYGNNVLSQLLILLGAISLVAPDMADCPFACNCIWAHGKYSAQCVSVGYTFVPPTKSNVQVLNLSNNYIKKLHNDSFGVNASMNLQKIYLKNNTIEKINRHTFAFLRILIELDLSDNMLNEIPIGTFTENVRLRILNLSGNPLKTLPDEQFPTLPYLKMLDLENCQLHAIQNNAFSNLTNLENLNLNANKFNTLSQIVFEPMPKLKTLSLDGNPWNCDCELRDFRNWYLSSRLNSVSLSCIEPEIHTEKLWENLISTDFSCYPETAITNDYTTYQNPGQNVTLNCKISGDPKPETEWLFKGHEIDPNTSLIANKYVIEENEDDFRISWSNLTIIDLIEEDTGEYICQAKNILATVIANASVILTHIYTPIKRSNNYWFMVTGLMVVGLMVFILFTSAVACGCMTYNRKLRRKHRRRAKLRCGKNIYDQEKQLLDMSSSNTEQFSRKSSCERLETRGSVELLKHPSSASIDRYSTRRPYKETTAVIPMSAFQNPLSICPPPPEFSNNIPHSNTLGNIYISVSLTDDPNITIERYPDLLNHRGSSRNILRDKPGTSEASGIPFATLPRRQLRMDQNRSTLVKNPKYDNMGKRITINGSSTLSLQQERDNIPTPPPPPLSIKPDYDYIPL